MTHRSMICSLASRLAVLCLVISPAQPAAGAMQPSLSMAPANLAVSNLIDKLAPGLDGPAMGQTTLSLGANHTCVLTAGNWISCWGSNIFGQLGDGTVESRSIAQEVQGLPGEMIALSAGGNHTCALTDHYAVNCWGFNGFGQLGDGTLIDQHNPKDVIGLSSGVMAISAGLNHTCALTQAGSVKCWGMNSLGQLGDASTDSKKQPVSVVGLDENVAGISAGQYSTCAVTQAGEVMCWGANGFGQLGNGTTLFSPIATAVANLNGSAVSVTVGANHACALTSSGSVKCWGINNYGQLGNGTTQNSSYPVDVVGLSSGVIAVQAGEYHTCALTGSEEVLCWGYNYFGQLGNGKTGIINNLPVAVSGVEGKAITLATGYQHTCLETRDGTVECWGDNSSGQLGDGAPLFHISPIELPYFNGNVTMIAVGQHHNCALTLSGTISCWGGNYNGQLGDGTIYSSGTPVEVSRLPDKETSLAAGVSRSCALDSAGIVRCWGDTPREVYGLIPGVVQVSVGGSHACALMSSGWVKCWGSNDNGQLGDGTHTYRSYAVDVVNLTEGATAISAGHSHTCALMSSGGVKCWGKNDEGELGDGSLLERTEPVDVAGLSTGVLAISSGWNYTCAVTSDSGAKCWGTNYFGELGDGTRINRNLPVDVTGLPDKITTVSAGKKDTCALTVGGGVKCWGDNSSGQLGDGSTQSSLSPVDVHGLENGVTAIGVGDGHACALTMLGKINCWGADTIGQVGVGRLLLSTVTVRSTGQAIVIPYSISGQILDTNDAPIEGVIIQDDAGHLTSTNNDGSYQFTNLPSGMYTLTPSKDGYFFDPASITISLPPDAVGQDFIALFQSPPSDSNRVFIPVMMKSGRLY